MSIDRPELKRPTLSEKRAQLEESKTAVLVGEHTEPWSFKPDPHSNSEVLETTRLLVAPAIPLRTSQARKAFLDEVFKGLPVMEYWVEAREWENRILNRIPSVIWFETVGIERPSNLIVLDEDILRRHGKIKKDYLYQRCLQINAYPTVEIAELYNDYLIQGGRGDDNYPPGTQNDLSQLWARITPQLFQRWQEGSDLHSFYFDSNGFLIPRFYRIPESRLEQARSETPKGSFFNRNLFTEVVQATSGTEVGARIHLYRNKTNTTTADVAESVFGNRLQAEVVESIEQGLTMPDDGILYRIRVYGLSADDFNYLKIFPEGYIPLRRSCSRLNFVKYTYTPQQDIEDQNPFGTLVREARLQRGLTQAKLAEAIGVKQVDVSLIERGAKKKLTEQDLENTAFALKLNDTETIALIRAFEKQYPNQ